MGYESHKSLLFLKIFYMQYNVPNVLLLAL